VYSAWARAQLGDHEAAVDEFRQALSALVGEGTKLRVSGLLGLLAEIEALAGPVGAALKRIDEALALANETGEHRTDAFLHSVHGEILLKRDSTNTVPAEEAFLTAIAVAQRRRDAERSGTSRSHTLNIDA
jgi:predicted ATPase